MLEETNNWWGLLSQRTQPNTVLFYKCSCLKENTWFNFCGWSQREWLKFTSEVIIWRAFPTGSHVATTASILGKTPDPMSEQALTTPGKRSDDKQGIFEMSATNYSHFINAAQSQITSGSFMHTETWRYNSWAKRDLRREVTLKKDLYLLHRGALISITNHGLPKMSNNEKNKKWRAHHPPLIIWSTSIPDNGWMS